MSNVDFRLLDRFMRVSYRISNTFKYSRRHRRYFCFIIYWTIGVKIPAPARLLCVAVPRRKNWSRLYARFIKRRKKLYVCIRSRVSGGNTRANQFRTAKVYEAGIRWGARFVYTGLSVVRFLLPYSHPSLSLRSLPSVLSTLAILIHQRDCVTSVITLCLLHGEMWYTRGGRNVILYGIIHYVYWHVMYN